MSLIDGTVPDGLANVTPAFPDTPNTNVAPISLGELNATTLPTGTTLGLDNPVAALNPKIVSTSSTATKVANLLPTSSANFSPLNGQTLTRNPNNNIITTIPDLADINITSTLSRIQDSTNFFDVLPSDSGNTSGIISTDEVAAAIEYRNSFKSGSPLTDYTKFYQSVENNYFSKPVDLNSSGGFSNDTIMFWVRKFFALPELTKFLNATYAYADKLRNVSQLNQIHLNLVLAKYQVNTNSFFRCYSDSVGLLANSKYHQLDSTQPIFDVTQQSYGVPIPFSANMESKVGPTARNLMHNLSKGCTALYRRNLMGIAYYNAASTAHFEVSSQVPHSLNLVNDIAFFVQFHKTAEDRMNTVKDSLPAFGGKLFQFIQYISNIGNRCSFNLRDVYAPINGYDKDFTVVPGSTDLAVGNLDQSVIDSQVNEFINFENADAGILQNLYGQTADLQSSSYVVVNQQIAKGLSFTGGVNQNAFPGYDANGNAVYYDINGNITNPILWKPLEGFGPYVGGTPVTTSTGITQQIDANNPPDQAQGLNISNFRVTSFGVPGLDSTTRAEVERLRSEGKSSAYINEYITSAAGGKYIEGVSIATNAINGLKTGDVVYLTDTKGNPVTNRNNQTGQYIVNGTGPADKTVLDIYYGNDRELRDKINTLSSLTIKVNKAESFSTGPNEIVSKTVTFPGANIQTLAPQIDTSAATAERPPAPNIIPTPSTAPSTQIPPPVDANGNTFDVTAAINAANQASSRLFSNRQRVIPFTFQIRTEDNDGNETRLNVDYLLKKVVIDNADPNKGIATLVAEKTNLANGSVTPGRGQTIDTYRTKALDLIRQQGITAPGAVKSVLEKAGVVVNSPIYKTLYNQISKIYEQRAITGNTLTRAAGTFINLASSRLPTNLLANITSSTSYYSSIASRINSLGGSTLLPSLGSIANTLNPFRFIKINLSDVIPSVSLGSLNNVTTLASQIATSGPPTSIDGAFEIIANIKDLICNFEIPFINIDGIKNLLTTKFKSIDIGKAIKEEFNKIISRIGDFFNPDNLLKNIWRPIEKSIKNYFLGIYKKLFVCDETKKQNKTGKKPPTP